MGYRSDVRIITSKKGFDKLKKYVEKDLSKETDSDKKYNLLENLDLDYKNSYSRYFGWNNIKWDFYNSDVVMNGLDYLEENDYSYKYSRIGESLDDCEEYCSDSFEDGEDYLESPYLERYFDDEKMKNIMENNNEK